MKFTASKEVTYLIEVRRVDNIFEYSVKGTDGTERMGASTNHKNLTEEEFANQLATEQRAKLHKD